MNAKISLFHPMLAGLALLFLTVVFAGCSASAAELDLKKAILGKWAGPAHELIDFKADGTVSAKTGTETVHGKYEVFGADPTRVQQNEISVQFSDSADALPYVGKLSESGAELTLKRSTGEISKFTRAK